MSAIAGILYFDGASVEAGLVEKLTTAMVKRGPDGQTHWVNGSVALGHCMLQTTPEALEEQQPMASRDGTLVLVWDGRLDNRDELRQALSAKGAIVQGNTDPELVLLSYAVWGEECPGKLLGDFVFALWDATQRRLFCATDHMGARPLYYCRTDRFLAFASEDEALLNLPGISRRVNEELIATYLVPQFQIAAQSGFWLKDMSVLRAATTLLVSENGMCDTHTYWQLEPRDELVFSSDEECEKAFLEVFSTAVHCRMRSAGQVAAMMSGGLDSASIHAMVGRLLPDMPGKEFHTYSAISDDVEMCIESQCILSLVKDSTAIAHFVKVPSFSGFGSIEDLVDVGWSGVHPVKNSILLPAMMCLAASRDGHQVMLHGCSGDLTTHSPNQYIANFLRRGRLGTAWNESRSASRNHTHLRHLSAKRILYSNLKAAFVPPRLRALAKRLRPSLRSGSMVRDIVNSQFVQRLDLLARIRAQQSVAAPPVEDIQRGHFRLLNSSHGIAGGLRAYERAAGRFGVELRDPWADRRVVEFFTRLPLKYKVRDGWTKYLARRTFQADWGIKVRERASKEHLGWIFHSRLMEESTQMMGDFLRDGVRCASAYLDSEKVGRNYSEHGKLEIGNQAERERQHSLINDLYDSVILTAWLIRMDDS